ncbi:hypothetical protein Hamer_G027529 [Homarus americanus]|uniref:Uncharacterized protein n=1 Tax=Homarus americanus TaxID=6706 RepID=A0A8J5JNI9_HOMAM|nr:hypothetical protein Hamer_G027529 [Homarus americanus]
MEESESQSGENAKGTVRPTSSTTRSATEIYLVGQPASSIRGSKLPTMRQVLKFFFHTVNESGDRQETFKETVRNVLTFWNLARIKTISERGCREKLTRLWEHWRSLQKSRDRAAKDKVENFKSQLDLLWDIGAPDAVEDIEKNRLLTPADKQQDIAFYQDQQWAREDYREAAELTLLVLGVNPPRGTHFLRPGACHHARWMVKIIYYLKIYMFSHQLELSSDLCVKLQRMAIFVSLLYTPAWLKSPVAEDAPVNDLQLHHELLRYRAVDCEVADAALAVASRHLWYLRPQTVVLSLCSEKLSAAEKKEMATKLSCLEETNDYANDNLVIQQTTRLSDLIDERSWMIFKEHHVCGTAWLMSPVEDWEKNEEFMKLKDFSRSLKVTNDVAERGIKLMLDFIGSVTKDEQQLQDVMQLVEKHRKQMSGFSKSALMQL